MNIASAPIPDHATANSSRRTRGAGNVEALLLLVGAFFALTAGLDWFKDKQAGRWTEMKLIGLAEEIVSLSETARIADVDLIVPGNVKGTIDRIARGGVATRGEFQGQFFGMPRLTGEAKERVADHLEFKLDRLSVVRLKAFASNN